MNNNYLMSKETNYDNEGIFFSVLLESQEVLGKMNFEIFLSAQQEAKSWADSLQDFRENPVIIREGCRVFCIKLTLVKHCSQMYISLHIFYTLSFVI